MFNKKKKKRSEDGVVPLYTQSCPKAKKKKKMKFQKVLRCIFISSTQWKKKNSL